MELQQVAPQQVAPQQAGPQPVSIAEVRNRDMLVALRALTAAVEKGQVRGLIFGVRYTSGSPDWDVGVTGDYAKDQLAALGLASKLWGRINEQHNREG